jgi:molybdenum cofactor cytidylyltransferase
MKFGPVAVTAAEGAIAAHSVRAGDMLIKKGTRLTAEHVARLSAAGVGEVIAARLEADDVPEDEAAHRLAQTAAGEGVHVEAPFTGRSNLFAETAGVLLVKREAIDRINLIDEAVTLATLAAFKPVVPGEMIATVKIIPYAVAGRILEKAEAAAKGARPLVDVAPYRLARVGVVSTLLPNLKPATVDKTLRVLDQRLKPAAARVTSERRVPHATKPLSSELAGLAKSDADLIIVFGASAIADRRDVIPAAIEEAGGRVHHLGMPVDPGNLLLLGELAGKPVIGAPGCARSPKENGFDWVLSRLLAKVPMTRDDIAGLGVGGLLMEIVSRPQPRGGGEAREDEE